METGKIKQLFQRYLSGQTSRKEAEAVDEWYQSFDNEVPQELSTAEEQLIRMEIWQRISPQIAVTKSFYRHTWLKIAAMLVFVIGAALVFFILKTYHDRPPAYTEIRTGNRERKTVKMEDGTLLTLNAGSVIRISKDLSAERRLDLVDGEVFFNVGPDTRRPFIVESGPLVTTVLGTSFNVSAYKDIHQLSITVMTGKISVSAKTTTQTTGILQGGQVMVYDKNKDTRNITTTTEGQPGWMQGKLVLNDVSFDEMAVLVEKNFGIRITTRQEKVKQGRYTTALQTNMDPAAAVEVLAAIHQLKISTNNHHVILYE